MATLVTEDGIVHYEAHGRGRPVLLLHAWMTSWHFWRSTIESLGGEFRLYALDFFGFGESGAQTSDFTVTSFVNMISQFMDRMGITKAPLLGHSMGGTVSLSTAIRFPEKVVKVAVVGSPLQGSSLSPMLKIAGYRGWVGLSESSPVLTEAFRRGFKPFIRGYSHLMSRDGRKLGDMLATDIGNLSIPAFVQSIGNLRQTDLRPRLGEITVPVLGIYGKHDNVVDPRQGETLKSCLPDSQIAWFENGGHFPMLDDPDRFHATIRAFLNGEPIPPAPPKKG